MFMQIGIDVAIIVVFIFLIKRLKTFKRDSSVNQGLKIFESLLTDADHTAIQLKEQLAEKNLLINKLNHCCPVNFFEKQVNYMNLN